MRRADRALHKREEITAILDACKVCRLGMVDAAGCYVVPLNFGYTWHADDTLTLYFHSASAGRKISALQQNPTVCFEMDCAHDFVGGAALTDYTYHYQSIIGNGTVTFLEEEAARMQALTVMIAHQTGMTAAEIARTPRDARWMGTDVMAVFTVTVTSFAAKKHA